MFRFYIVLPDGTRKLSPKVYSTEPAAFKAAIPVAQSLINQGYKRGSWVNLEITEGGRNNDGGGRYKLEDIATGCF